MDHSKASPTTSEPTPRPTTAGKRPETRGWRRLLSRARLGRRSRRGKPTVLPPPPQLEHRREPRAQVQLRASTTSIDPVRNPVSGETYYECSENEQVLNLSRRGVGLRCSQPPTVGTRLLLQLHLQGESSPIELIGRTCWSRVEVVRGAGSRRAAAGVGIELTGGSRDQLNRYERSLARLHRGGNTLLATPEGLG